MNNTSRFRVMPAGIFQLPTTRPLGKWLVAMLACFQVNGLAAPNAEMIDGYIEQWVEFYPTAAFNEGLVSAAQRFESYSQPRLSSWLELNRRYSRSLASLPAGSTLDQRIDARVLGRQVSLELEKWEQDRVISQQPQWYAAQISEALTRVLVSEKLTAEQRAEAVKSRLQGVRSLCRTGLKNLSDGSPDNIIKSLNSLTDSIDFYGNKLFSSEQDWVTSANRESLRAEIDETVASLQLLTSHIRQKVQPTASLPNAFGKENYRRKLALYSDRSLTPDDLAALALQEIDRVRDLMLALARDWWNETNAGGEAPADPAALDAALEAMEADRATTRKEFLEGFRTITRQSIDFVIEAGLATPPKNLSVVVDQLPDHSPFATIGVVLPPGPFDPAASTLLYLPSIPDDAAAERKEGFYRSFNNHFNRMIISHEIFPGHDMQFKVGLEHSTRVRALYSNPYLAEGWASFSEVLMLDAGWGGGNRLTRLAHLRKRLENATRAYISVMVHSEGWNRDAVVEFAVTRGLLPAQFAANLWDRASHPDMALQLTTYFAGYHGIRRLWLAEQERLGQDFVPRQLVDTILRAGSVPIDALQEIVRHAAGRPTSTH